MYVFLQLGCWCLWGSVCTGEFYKWVRYRFDIESAGKNTHTNLQYN